MLRPHSDRLARVLYKYVASKHCVYVRGRTRTIFRMARATEFKFAEKENIHKRDAIPNGLLAIYKKMYVYIFLGHIAHDLSVVEHDVAHAKRKMLYILL